jgi:hypothetical protein
VSKLFNTILTGLGLLPAEMRSVKPMPAELKALVPPPVDNNLTVKPGTPDVERDTMPLIINKAKRTAWQVKKLAARLKGATLAATLNNISQFILMYVKYQKDDENHEQVRSPRRLVHEGHGDCDCFTVFIAAVLYNLGITFRLRIAKYETGDWSHIYIVVPKDQRNKNKALNDRSEYFVLDPVTNKHDYEVSFHSKKDYTMSLQFLDGIPSSPLYQTLSGLACCCDDKKDNSNNGNGDHKRKTIYVVSGRALNNSGLERAENFLKRTGLPFQLKTTDDGLPFYEVQTPAGPQAVKEYIPSNRDQQQALANILTAPPATVQASTENIQPGTVAKAAGWALGLTAFVLAVKAIRESQTSAKGLGALPRKKLPVVQL